MIFNKLFKVLILLIATTINAQSVKTESKYGEVLPYVDGSIL